MDKSKMNIKFEEVSLKMYQKRSPRYHLHECQQRLTSSTNNNENDY